MIASDVNMEFETRTRIDPTTGIVFVEEHSFYSPPNERQKETSGFHRADGPAVVYRDRASGVAVVEHYFRFGSLSRTNGPASIKRDPATSIVTQEEYAVDGAYHRSGGPARIERDPISGKVLSEAYYNQGRLHRKDGPAFVLYDEYGKVLKADYYLDGKEVCPNVLEHRLGTVQPKQSSTKICTEPRTQQRATGCPSWLRNRM